MTGQSVGRWWWWWWGGGYINSTGVLQEQQRNLCMRIEETLLCVDIDPTAPITQVNWTFISV